MILHDTSEVVEMLRGRDTLEEAGISFVTLMEALRGIPSERREQSKSLLEERYVVYNVDNTTILIYCRLYDGLKEAKSLIPDSDLLIAATAIRNKIPLRSRDARFDRLRDLGLAVEKP